MNILVIGSHPDDFEYGCGGALLKLKSFGAKINILVMTLGELGGNPEVRKKEQEKVGKLLRAKIFFGNFPDTKISLSKELINCIEQIIKNVKPDIIFVHYPEDTHQDHRNVSQATITATRYARNVLFYESPTSINFSPTIFVDIGDVLNKKMSLLKTHRSQVNATKIRGMSIIEGATSCAIFRGYQTRVKYAEGFVPLRFSLDLCLK
ncbi:MAG: PIG-L deacetylase family protein [Endomicrobiia bacterium]